MGKSDHMVSGCLVYKQQVYKDQSVSCKHFQAIILARTKRGKILVETCCFLWCCTHLHSHQECRSIPFCLHALQHGFSVGGVLDGGHSNLCEGISHGSFVLPGLSS